MMQPGLAVLATLLCGAEARPPAGPATSLLDELQKLNAANKLATARPQAEALLDLIAGAAPLEIVDAQLMGTPAEGLGMYTPLLDGVAPGPELYVYAQVRNHGLRKEGGWYELYLVSDLIVLDDAGKEIGRDEGFGESRFRARAPHRDTFVNIVFKVQGLPKGGYKLRLVLHDRIGKKDAHVELPFRMP